MVRNIKEEVQEVRLPSEGEVVGIIVQLLGFDRVKVRCSDGKIRVCRIPGKMKKKVWLKIAFWSIPLGFIASELGWIVAEVGRQPWTIQDLLPTMASTSHLSTSSVQTTFWLFTVLFTVLIIAEFKIKFFFKISISLLHTMFNSATTSKILIA